MPSPRRGSPFHSLGLIKTSVLTCPYCSGAFSETRVVTYDFRCPTCDRKLKSNAAVLTLGNLLVLGILTLPFDGFVPFVLASVSFGAALYFVTYKPFLRVWIPEPNDEA
jgi:hypothetical protein